MVNIKAEDWYMFMGKEITEWKNENSCNEERVKMTKKFGLRDTRFKIVLMHILVLFTGSE